MNSIIKIIEELRSTSSTNEKLEVLKREKDNELLKKVLKYTYNPFKKYGISEKSLILEGEKVTYNNIFNLLDVLSNSNINDLLRLEVNSFLYNILDSDLQDLYKCMILKDLKININTKGINKVFPNLIPSFDVMLAESFFKQKDGFLNGRDFILTTKLDGCRMCAIKDDNKVKFYSRQGQIIEGLIDIENALAKLPNGYVLDGELLLRNTKNLPSDELYRESIKIIRKDGIKRNLEFHVFDMIELESFKRGFDKTKCSDRKENAHTYVKFIDSEWIVEVPILYKGNDEGKILEFLNIVKAKNEEGIMLNIANAPYECKRSKGILKVKVFQDCDVKVLGVIEGNGKNKNKLGAITIQFEHEGNLYTCDCGSGFSDYERGLYWKNKELLIGKIVTIGYFEVSKNSKTKDCGLRFPTWKGIIRDDKAEISMY